MQIRPLRAEELEEFILVQSDAFIEPLSEVQDWVEKDIRPNLQDTRALVGQDGRIRAAAQMLYYNLWLGGGTVPLPGFASVATPPEYRRTGQVKQLLTGILAELREAGYGVAALYPFYYPFYKRFGFDNAGTTRHVTVEMGELTKLRGRTAGEWRQLTPDHWAEFNALYERWCRGTFGNLTREERHWRNNVLKVPTGMPPRKNYMWYNPEGQPEAYLLWRYEKALEMHNQIMVREMVWLSPEGKRQVYNFLANLDARADRVTWLGTFPPDEELLARVDDPEKVDEKVKPGYMLRIVDAARALEQRPWPAGSNGAFTLALRDEVLEWNNAALRVEVLDGKARLEKLPNAAGAALSCHARQLAQMYAGYLSPLKLYNMGLLESRHPGELETAQALFAPPGQAPSHMNDWF